MSSLEARHLGQYGNDNADRVNFEIQATSLVPIQDVKGELHKVDTKRWRQDSKRYKITRWLKSNLFLILTAVGIATGLLVGLTVRTANPSIDTLIWIGMPGELYMRILQSMILPLIVCTVIDGTANADPKSNGRIGLVTMSCIVINNILGGVVGTALCLIIRPGSAGLQVNTDTALDTRNLQTIDIFADFIRNIFPDNIVAAMMQMSQTKYSTKEFVLQKNVSGQLVNVTSVELVKSVTSVAGTNLLGLIVISAAFGIAASQAGDKARPFVEFFNSGARVIFQLFHWAKWTTPVGVASLIARALAKVNNIQSAFSTMGMFILTTSGGCLLYQLTIYPFILVTITRTNPFRFFQHAVKPWIIGFAPATSTMPLPDMMRICTEVYKVDPRVAGFTLPFSTTLNRGGSVLFIAVTCLFVAQYGGTVLDTADVFTIALLSMMSSFALPSVPSSSVVAILIILGSMGIPSHNIGLVMAVEWLNDRIRTTTNVISHMTTTLVTWKLCRVSLERSDRNESHYATNKEIDV